MSRPVVAIFASGSGTTAEAFIHASGQNQIEPLVGLIITNNSQAGIVDKIKQLNQQYGFDIKTIHISGTTHPAQPGEDVKPGQQTNAEETAILKHLEATNYDAIVLMGYMKKMGPRLVKCFGWRPDYTTPYQAQMLNTHPGLLPYTKGLFGIHVQEHTLTNKLPHGGQTLHIVAEDYDDGPIIAENKVLIQNNDTPDSLFERVKITEKKHLPTDVANFIKERNKWRRQNG